MPTAISRPTLSEALEDYDPEPGEAEVRRFRNMKLKGKEKVSGSYFHELPGRISSE